jgi:hypothetical protein
VKMLFFNFGDLYIFLSSLFFPFCWVYKHDNMVSQHCQVLFVCLPNFLLTRFTSRVIMSLQGRNGKQ